MLRTMFQPRYAALSVLMVIVAAICTTAGVWQVVRLGEKINDNDAIRANAHAPASAVASVLPLAGAGARPRADAVEYRNVTASGVYLAAGQVLVRQRSVSDTNGFLVLTPLRTAEGPTLLVVRGFVPVTGTATQTPAVAAAPGGTVEIRGRVERDETRNDDFAALHSGQVESINPADQAARLGTSVYNGYVELLAAQPGTGGLTAIPDPDLSNPAGGAIEPQHLAYVIQWFLFAALALAAPFVMARAETRPPPLGDLDEFDPAPAATAQAPAATASHEQVVADKLADRYGRVRRPL